VRFASTPKTIELPGAADEVSARELQKAGVRLPFAGNRTPNLEQTDAVDSASAALAAGKKLAAKYVQDHDPGGMAEVVAIVSWPEHELFCAVVNMGYSGS
jgi:hypothetical protein